VNKLQAAMKDHSAMTWRERKVMFRVGSVFRGCHFCGITYWVELPSGKEVERWSTGLNVFRAYQPSASGFTYYCWDCSAKDLQCWDWATDIGMDAIVGCRGAVKARKYALRKELAKFDDKMLVLRAPSRAAEIAKLEAELARLMEIVKQGGK
jgi:hypothetical protein